MKCKINHQLQELQTRFTSSIPKQIPTRIQNEQEKTRQQYLSFSRFFFRCCLERREKRKKRKERKKEEKKEGMSATTEKEHLTIVFNGNVDVGKSTTAGHLITKLHPPNNRILERVEFEAKQLEKKTFKYAWMLDHLKAERDRGITITSHVTRCETSKYDFTLIDTPGHRHFVKNMMNGASQGDVSILVVSATEQFGGVDEGKTREHEHPHPSLTFCLGVTQMICLINKMDEVNYSKDQYNHVKNGISEIVRKAGYKNVDKVAFIPISGWLGENLTERSPSMGWYEGPILVEALNNLTVPRRAVDKPLRIPLRDAFRISGIGLVAVGRIATGKLEPGMHLTFAPHEDCIGKAHSIERHHRDLREAVAGDQVGVNMKGLSHIQWRQLRRGNVAGEPNCHPPSACESFEAKVIITKRSIHQGYTPLMHIHTANVACKFSEILRKIDRVTGETVEEYPSSLRMGEMAIVRMEPMKPLVVENFREFSGLGRFVCRDYHEIVAIGVVLNVTKKGAKRLVKSAVKATGKTRK